MVSHCGASRLANRAWVQLEAITSGRAALAVRTRGPRRSCNQQRHAHMQVWTDSELLREGPSDKHHHASSFVAAAGASLRAGALGAYPLALAPSKKPIPPPPYF